MGVSRPPQSPPWDGDKRPVPHPWRQGTLTLGPTRPGAPASPGTPCRGGRELGFSHGGCGGGPEPHFAPWGCPRGGASPDLRVCRSLRGDLVARAGPGMGRKQCEQQRDPSITREHHPSPPCHVLTWKPEGPGAPCSPLSPAGPYGRTMLKDLGAFPTPRFWGHGDTPDPHHHRGSHMPAEWGGLLPTMGGAQPLDPHFKQGLGLVGHSQQVPGGRRLQSHRPCQEAPMEETTPH